MSTTDQALREHVVYLLQGGGAHLDFSRAIADIPPEKRGEKVPLNPHTLWHQLEHLRICQWDILEFSRNPDHISPEFPEGYWPNEEAPPHDSAWEQSIRSFEQDLQEMVDLVLDTKTDLLTPIPHGDGQTILREALLIAEHNAYHLGQIVILRRCLGIWED